MPDDTQVPIEPRRVTHGDPLLVDHAENNQRWRDHYRRAVVDANRASRGLDPLPKRSLLDRILGRDRQLADELARTRAG